MQSTVELGTCLAPSHTAPAQQSPSTAKGNSAASARQNFLFVDNVRFWSMFAIIALHSAAILGWMGRSVPGLTQAVTTPVKFGTIGFFLISGFLLGDRLETCAPLEYLGRRVKKVFFPWLVWFSGLLMLSMLADQMHHRVTLGLSLDGVLGFLHEIVETLFLSAFWFVPNLLLALSILLLFRRFIRDLRFGAVLLALNLFYVVNIYKMWLPSGHTQAFLGFVFYLWLGAYASCNFDRLNQWISSVRTGVLVALALLTGLLAFGEARLLFHLNSPDPMNTLRLTNQVFSVVVTLLLLKVRRVTSPSFVNVRRHTFGLYLSHSIILRIILVSASHKTPASLRSTLLSSDLGLVFTWLFTTAAVYFICHSIVKAIDARPSLQWTIGSDSPQPSRRPAARSTPQLDPLVPARELSV